MARLIKTDGRALDVQPLDEKRFTLREMQAIVDGYIEAVYLFDDPDGWDVLWCNEEGKLRDLPRNDAATAFMRGRSTSLRPNDWIVGDALLTKRAETEGDEEDEE